MPGSLGIIKVLNQRRPEAKARPRRRRPIATSSTATAEVTRMTADEWAEAERLATTLDDMEWWYALVAEDMTDEDLQKLNEEVRIVTPLVEDADL